MSEPIETVIIRSKQKFDLQDVLNPVQIEVNNDRILNILKKHKNIYYQLTPISIFFSFIRQKQHKTDICYLQRAKQCKNCSDQWKNCKYTWTYKFK